MSMKTIFEQVIARGGFDLTAMLARIDEYHIEGKLDDDERDALYAVARENAKAQYDYASEIESLWTAVRDIRDRLTALEGESTEEPDEPADEWPEYVQPTGAHDAYQAGDKITFNGQRYVCRLANCVCRRTHIRRGGRHSNEPDTFGMDRARQRDGGHFYGRAAGREQERIAGGEGPLR